MTRPRMSPREVLDRYGMAQFRRFVALYPILYPIIQEYGWDPGEDSSWKRAAKIAVARGQL